jgi:hypothetical protein
MTILTGRLRVLAATASIIVLAGMTLPGHAGGLGGVTGAVGGVTGAVSGAVGSATGTVGGAVGSATGSVSGAISGATGSVSGALGGATGGAIGGTTSGTSNQSLASTGWTSPTKTGILSNKALIKLKANILGIKAGIYVLDSYGNLVRINARIAEHFLKARANVYVLHHGSLVKVNAKVVLAGLYAKAKVYVLDKHGQILKGIAFVNLGGIKAKALAKVGTGGVAVKVGILIGGRKHHGPGGPGEPGQPPGNPGTPGNTGTPPSGVSNEIASLSDGERKQLKKRCVSVLSNPAAYSGDAVTVCRVLAQLAGI